MSLSLLKPQELSQQLAASKAGGELKPCCRARTSPVVRQVSCACLSKEIKRQNCAFLIPVGLQDVELLRGR